MVMNNNNNNKNQKQQQRNGISVLTKSSSISSSSDVPNYIPKEKHSMWRQEYVYEQYVPPSSSSKSYKEKSNNNNAIESSNKRSNTDDNNMEENTNKNKSKKTTTTVSFSLPEGMTAHTAAATGKVPVLKRIEKRDSKLLTKLDVNGWRPLHEAARRGQTTVLKYLLENYDHDVNERTNDGRGGTALFWAEQTLREDHESIKYLKKKGAKNIAPNYSSSSSSGRQRRRSKNAT